MVVTDWVERGSSLPYVLFLLYVRSCSLEVCLRGGRMRGAVVDPGTWFFSHGKLLLLAYKTGDPVMKGC